MSAVMAAKSGGAGQHREIEIVKHVAAMMFIEYIFASKLCSGGNKYYLAIIQTILQRLHRFATAHDALKRQKTTNHGQIEFSNAKKTPYPFAIGMTETERVNLEWISKNLDPFIGLFHLKTIIHNPCIIKRD